MMDIQPSGSSNDRPLDIHSESHPSSAIQSSEPIIILI